MVPLYNLFALIYYQKYSEKIERNLKERKSLIWVEDIFREKENNCCL